MRVLERLVRWSRARLVVSVALILACASPPGKAPAEPGPEQWQALAKADLDAVHQLAIDAHPGTLDDENPAFREWTESGYRQALALVPRVFHCDSLLAVVRFYATGFRDGHLIYSDNIRADGALMHHTGWQVGYANQRYVVTTIASEWPVQLPPVGTTLLRCDGRPVEAIVRDDVAPYMDRREVLETREFVANRSSRDASSKRPPRTL